MTLTNGQIQTNGVTNRSRIGILRADVNVGVRYEDDLQRAKQILEQLLSDDSRVLADPAPAVLVTDFVSSGIMLSARPFALFSDIKSAAMRPARTHQNTLREAGISIAFPLITAA